MTNISNILDEISSQSGSNYKLSVLNKYASNEMLQRVLKMTYDNVAFTYGVTMQQVDNYRDNYTPKIKQITLEDALDVLEYKLATREITGHKSIETILDLIESLEIEDVVILQRIINRDQRLDMGKTLINKIWPGLVIKPVYMRCGIYTNKTNKGINFPAYLQKKADGTYREITIFNGNITGRTRSGQNYVVPKQIADVMCDFENGFEDGVYFGELTLHGISDRSKSNGLINSDNPPNKDILFEMWDCVTLDEYEKAVLKYKNLRVYGDRLKALELQLKNVNNKHVKLIEYYYVGDLAEALHITSKMMQDGYEGSILKDSNALFKDGTSTKQLKIKLEIDADVRIVGFKDGKKGTKREGKIGSLQYATDDGKVKGYVSGFTDKLLNEITKNKSKYLNQIMAIVFNDITQAEGNEHYSLSHPRFVEVRNDKTETDTLERLLENKQMSMLVESFLNRK